MSHMTDDERYMCRCIQLARNGQQNAKPNPMVGAVIVSADGRIIGEGYHVRCGEGHAEVNAFASVRPEDEELLREATMYVSLEPCSHYGKTPPCADLIIKKGVRRVVVGCIDEFAEVQGRGIQKLRDAGIDVTVGVLEEECRALNRRFFTYHRLRRPYIILKWAQTANGFIDDNGKALQISSPYTQMLSHKLRAEEDAILVGRVTNEREHPQLTVRHWCGPDPKRLVVDRTHPEPRQPPCPRCAVAHRRGRHEDAPVVPRSGPVGRAARGDESQPDRHGRHPCATVARQRRGARNEYLRHQYNNCFLKKRMTVTSETNVYETIF